MNAPAPNVPVTNPPRNRTAPALLAAARGVANLALSFVYPEACQVCGVERATPAEGYVCAGCFKNLRFIVRPFCERCGLPFEGEITTAFECTNCREMELHFTSARSVIAAQGMALDLIHRYKYSDALWLEPFLGGLLNNAASPALRAGHWSLIVPVPLHPQKLAEREFNQAGRLAHRLAQATGLPLAAGLVRRVEATRTQTRLSRGERAKNVRRAFAPAPGARCDGARVVLIDDVLTTGATTSACARVLLGLGAQEVCVWTLARGLLH